MERDRTKILSDLESSGWADFIKIINIGQTWIIKKMEFYYYRFYYYSGGGLRYFSDKIALKV